MDSNIDPKHFSDITKFHQVLNCVFALESVFANIWNFYEKLSQKTRRWSFDRYDH